MTDDVYVIFPQIGVTFHYIKSLHTGLNARLYAAKPLLKPA